VTTDPSGSFLRTPEGATNFDKIYMASTVIFDQAEWYRANRQADFPGQTGADEQQVWCQDMYGCCLLPLLKLSHGNSSVCLHVCHCTPYYAIFKL
jgi:hypothetical protein